MPSESLAPRARSSHGGWIATLITVSGAVILQLLQMHVADAEKMQYVAAGVSLDAKIVAFDAKLDRLSERITAIEQSRQIEAQIRISQQPPLTQGSKK